MTAWDSLAAQRSGVPVFVPGHVWLAGAGPGDPGLLTLDALAGLAQADVIVHDALVDPRVLSLAGERARLEFAGKRGGKPSATQADICERLIALARAGQRVLRLKGGDPFVFGRGGEEAAALIAAGIPYRVIPGVTAGLAALDLEINRQATMIAYLDDFMLMTVITLGAIPLLLLLRKAATAPTAMPMAE